MTENQWLFSYGTLRQPQVQQQLSGRALNGAADVLPGFCVEPLKITDPDVVALSGSDEHPVLRRGLVNDQVEGMALAVSDEDLRHADLYEVSDYVRIAVMLGSGKRAFVYVHADDRR